jgi:hypothetical protein
MYISDNATLLLISGGVAMDYISFTIGLIGLILAIVGFPMLYDWIKSKASDSLLKGIRVRPLDTSEADGDTTYWIVEITTCIKNHLYKLLSFAVSKKVRVIIKFESENDVYRGKGFEYQTVFGLLDNDTIKISPNSVVKVAIAKREFGKQLSTLGGIFGFKDLVNNFDAIVTIWDADKNKMVSPVHRVIKYIREGNPTVDEINKNEL